MSVRIENLLTALGVTLLVALLYFTSPTFFESIDYVLFYRPNFHFLTEAVRAGEVPWWNPYIGLGRPYLADVQNAVFYPPIYLLLLGPAIGVALLVWFHTMLAVFGLRALGRGLGLTRSISGLISFSLAASIAVTGRLYAGQLLYVCAIGYLPWLLQMSWLAGVEARMDWRRLGAWSGLLALQFLCGHPQIFWLSGLAQVVFIFGGSLRGLTRDSFSALGRGLGALGLAGALAAGVVAVVLLPFLELVAQSNRMAPSLALASYGKLLGPELLTLFLRSPHAHLVDWERNLFMGLPLVVAGLAGLIRIRDHRQRTLLLLALTGLLLALADGTPFGWVFHRVLPGYSVFRLHARAGLLIVLALALAAGLWLSDKTPGRAAWVGLGVAGALIFGLIVGLAPESREGSMWTTLPVLTVLATIILLLLWIAIRPARPGLAVCVLLAFALVQAMGLVNENIRVKNAYGFFNAMHSTGRFPAEAAMTSALESAGLLRPGLPPPRVLAEQHAIPPNFAMLHGYSSVDAYTSLFPARPWRFLHGVTGVTEDEGKNTSLSPAITAQGTFPIPGFYQTAGLDSSRQAIEITTNPPPRAFVVFATQSVSGLDEAVNKLRAGHDIYRSALIESGVGVLREISDPPGVVPVTIGRFERNRLAVELDLPRDGLLVLAEVWYPGWRLEMNGRVVEGIPANAWMRAFPVPGGKNSAEIVFRQNRVWPGAGISLISLSLLAFVALGKSRVARAG